MANRILDFIKNGIIRDDDSDDETAYQEYKIREEEKQNRIAAREAAREAKESVRDSKKRLTPVEEKPVRDYSSDLDREEAALASISELRVQNVRPRPERTRSGNYIPHQRTPQGSDICIMKPNCFDDALDICDQIAGNCAVVINLEGAEPELAQRVVDFVCGALYVQKGNLRQISDYILIVAPETFDISGDYIEIIAQGNGFGVPEFKTE